MRMLLRILAVVGVLAGVSFVGPSAHADHIVIEATPCASEPTPPPGEPSASPTPEPTPAPQPQNCIPASGSRLTGTMTLQFSVRVGNSGGPLSSVNMFIESQEEGVPNAKDVWAGRTYTRQQNVRSDTFDVPWDTVTTTPYNGEYRIRVVASVYSSTVPLTSAHSREATWRGLLVDNPPVGIAAARIVAKTPTSVSVEWDAAVEPDVKSYTLYRAMTDSADKVPPYSAFTEVAKLTATNLKDAVQEEGFYWYTVIVTRRSVVTPEIGISSVPSPISAAAEVEEAEEQDEEDAGAGAVETQATPVPFKPRVVSRLPSLTLPRVAPRGAPAVPDAPFSAVLPYDVPEGGEDIPEPSEPGADPRGPVLPVAVGAFLVSSALALGRMPY